MPRRAAKIDANHNEIVRALRDIGAGVQSLASLGKGCPDLLVGFRGQCFCLEVKDGSKPPSAQALTPDEERWEENWPGHYRVVRSVDDALRALGVLAEASEETKL